MTILWFKHSIDILQFSVPWHKNLHKPQIDIEGDMAIFGHCYNLFNNKLCYSEHTLTYTSSGDFGSCISYSPEWRGPWKFKDT